MKNSLAALALLLSTAPALACDPVARVIYRESAPTDFLTIENASVGQWRLTALEIDLAPSAGQLVFDPLPGGSGIGSAAPMLWASGVQPSTPPTPLDGAKRATLNFAGLPPQQRSVFSLDLDDTLPASSLPTRVAFAEIEGARIVAAFTGPNSAEFTLEGFVGPNGEAVLEPRACV
ncbi:MAG: hypothetical protein KTR21_10115 [Rhodobacteraceae bacterium]|nr:hypothetical protein [Paracoccaceae bacterium]